VIAIIIVAFSSNSPCNTIYQVNVHYPGTWKGAIISDKTNKKILQFILGNGKPQYSIQNVDFNIENLNILQKEAITRTIGADCFHLIIGPSGT
jgi:hypothetical protein